jgi:transposase
VSNHYCQSSNADTAGRDDGAWHDRACLNGILVVLTTGIGWQQLPQQLGYGSGMTCWRRLRD